MFVDFFNTAYIGEGMTFSEKKGPEKAPFIVPLNTFKTLKMCLTYCVLKGKTRKKFNFSFLIIRCFLRIEIKTVFSKSKCLEDDI